MERADIHFPSEPPVVAKRKSGSRGEGVFRAGEAPLGLGLFLRFGLCVLGYPMGSVSVAIGVSMCMSVSLCM